MISFSFCIVFSRTAFHNFHVTRHSLHGFFSKELVTREYTALLQQTA